MKFFFPAALILISIGLFFVYTDSAYQGVQQLREDEAQFDEALQRSRELQAVRDALLSRYNTFAAADIERLEKLLPDNVDNVRLALELDGIASRYGMRLDNVVIQEGATEEGSGAVGPSTRPYETVFLSFNVVASYDDFMAFMNDLETSLRVVDLTNLSFEANDTGAPYGYAVSIKTYWLK